MQNIQIKVDVEQLGNAIRYLKDPSAGLDVGDLSAVGVLSELWRSEPFSGELSSNCAELLDSLKNNLRLYSSSNKKTNEQLKTFIGIAKKIYCGDKTTYDTYVKALREYYKVRKIPAPPPDPQPQKKAPVVPDRQEKSEIRIISVDFCDSDAEERKFGLVLPTTLHYLCPRIKYTITPAPRTPVEVKYRIFSPSGEMEKNSVHADGFLGSRMLTSREGTEMLDSWGNSEGVCYYEGQWRFELYSDSKLINTTYFEIKSPFAHTPPSIDIQKVEFANTDYDGGILNDFGTALPQSVRYLTPRIHFTVRNKENRRIELRHIVYDPDGTPMKNSSRNDGFSAGSYINLAFQSPAVLSGFGNREGNSYVSGQYRIEIYEGDYLLYTSYVKIGNGLPFMPPPTPVAAPQSAEKPRSSRKGCWKTIGWILLIYFLYTLLLGWCGRDDADEWKDGADKYVLASQVFLRSSPDASSNSNIITKFPYGMRLSCISDADGWLKVKEPQTGRTGYVARDYVIDTQDFNCLDSIWSERSIVDDVELTRHRRALLDLQKLMKPKLDGSYFILNGPSDNWLEKSVKDGYDDFPEFAFIVKDAKTGQRRTAVYSFYSDERPVLRHVEDAPPTGGIKNISYKSDKGYSVSYGTQKAQSKKAKKSSSTAAPEAVIVEEVPDL